MGKLTAVVAIVLLALADGQLFDTLYNNLTGSGAQNTIPVSNRAEPLNISMGMDLIRINSLDTTTGDIELLAWISYNWIDGRLTWSPDNFDGVEIVHLPISEVWNHDIVLYLGDTEEKPTPCVVTDKGSVVRIPATIIKTRCNVSDYSTNNTVNCNLKFGSWTYSGAFLNLLEQSQTIGVSQYSLSGGWVIEDTSVKRNVRTYDCCPEPYIDLEFTLTLTRSG